MAQWFLLASHQADPGARVPKTFSEEVNGGVKRKVDSGSNPSSSG